MVLSVPLHAATPGSPRRTPTIRTSSSTVTAPSASQSPVHAPADNGAAQSSAPWPNSAALKNANESAATMGTKQEFAKLPASGGSASVPNSAIGRVPAAVPSLIQRRQASASQARKSSPPAMALRALGLE